MTHISSKDKKKCTAVEEQVVYFKIRFRMGAKVCFFFCEALSAWRWNSPEHQVSEMLPGMNTLTYFPAVLC